MSDPGNEGFYRPKFYDEVNNTLTASTDVITHRDSSSLLV